MLVIPTLLAVGLADRWLVGTTGVVERFVGSGARVLTASAPPGHAATVVGLRFLALFAFLQTMHYVVWVAFLPKFAIDASQTFEARMPWLTVRRLWTLGGVAALFLRVRFGFRRFYLRRLRAFLLRRVYRIEHCGKCLSGLISGQARIARFRACGCR